MALALLLAATCLAGTAAVPSPSLSSCASRCEKSTKFAYEKGKIYTYDYETNFHTLVGSDDQIRNFQITAQAEISSLNPCNLILRFNDVRVVKSTGIHSKSEEIKRALEKNSLVFAFQDGRIDSLCSSPDDSSWVTNFKKGFLSALQNSMPDLSRDYVTSEIDVSGQCPTNYVITHHKWDSRNVRKSKDFSKCTQRNRQDNVGIQFFPHFPSTSSESVPLLQTDFKCDQEIGEDKIVHLVKCEEKYTFNPFTGNLASRIETNVKQTLKFVASRPGSNYPPDDYSKRSTLLYEHEKSVTSPQDDYSYNVQEILHKLNLRESIQPETPTLFKSLVLNVRKLEFERLKLISDNFRDSSLASKFFLDAVQMAMTSSSVKLMTDLIERRVIDDKTKDGWFLSLAFVPNPKKELIDHLYSVLKKSPSQKTLLGLSALVNNYCQQDRVHCENEPNVLAVVDKISENLPKNCQPKEEKDIKNILVTLKAIGNVGILATNKFDSLNSHKQHLSQCISNLKNPIEIRVAAIEALRRSACGTLDETLADILSDHRENVEVRIASYLSLMRCPNEETIRRVKLILDYEEINQVGSFMWTHLINIQNTVQPAKKSIKRIVQSHVLRQKFSTDALKFSRAYERSFYSEKLQTGVHGEANVIFSPESYLPRSLSTNLTINFFGRTINLLEIGGRMEGFEPWVESLLGPNGLYHQHLSKNSSLDPTIVDKEKLNKIDQQFNVKDKTVEPKASAYLRVFGNEIQYLRSGNEEKNLEDFFNWLFSDKEMNWNQGLTFVDTTLVIPTSIGFPLNLTLNGSSVVQLQMKGQSKMRDLFNLDCDFDGYIKPSAAVQLSGSISLDINDVQLGIRLDANAYTSSSLSGKIKIKGGQLVSFQLDAPQDKQELINMNTQLFFVDDGSEIPLQGKLRNVVDLQACTGSFTDTILGVELCGGVSYPDASNLDHAPGFPLTGPASLYLTLRKSDPTLTSYNFDYRWQDIELDDNYVEKRREISLDTPGSTVDRRWSAQYSLNQKEKSVLVDVKTPIKKLGVRGRYVNEYRYKQLDVGLTIDNVDQIVFQAELNVDVNGDATRYVPNVHLQLPGIRPISLVGYVTVQSNGKLALDLSLHDLTIRPVTLTGAVSLSKNRYDVDVTLNSFLLTTRLVTNVHYGKKNIFVNIATDWSLMEMVNKHYEANVKFRDSSNAFGDTRLSASGEIKGSLLPSLIVTWEYQRKRGHVENQVEFKADSKSFTTRYVYDDQFLQKTRTRNRTVQLTANCPTTGFDWAVVGNFIENPSSAISEIEVRRKEKVLINSGFKMHAMLRPSLDVAGEFYAKWPGQDVKIVTQVKRINFNEYEGNVLVQFSPQERHMARGKFQDYSTPGQLSRAVSLELISPKWPATLLSSELKSGQVYSSNTRVNFNDKKYGLNAQYELQADQGQKVSTEVTWAGDTYVADGTFTITEDKKSVTVNVIPRKGKRIEGSFHYIRKEDLTDGHLNLKWDADLHPENEFVLKVKSENLDDGCRLGSGQIDFNGSPRVNFVSTTKTCPSARTISHETTLVVGMVDGRNFSAAIEFNYHGPTSDRTGDLKALAEFKVDGGNSYTKNGVTYVQQNLLFRISSYGKIRSWGQNGRYSVEGNIKAELPRSQQPVIISLDHSHSGRDFLTSVKFEKYPSKSFNLTIGGSDSTSRGVAKYQGGTSISVGNSRLFSIDGQVESNYPTTTGKIAVRIHEKVASLQVTKQTSTKPEVRGFSSSFLLKLPLKSEVFNEIRGSINFFSDQTSLYSKSEVYLGRHLWLLDWRVSSKRENNGHVLTGTANLQTPMRSVNDVSLIYTRVIKDGTAKTLLQLKLSPTWDATWLTETRVTTRSDFEHTTKLTIADYHSSKIHIKHLFDSMLDSSIEVSYNKKNAGVRVIGLAKRDHVFGRLELLFPFGHNPKYNVMFEYEKNGNQVKVEGKVDNERNLFRIESIGVFDRWDQFENNLLIEIPVAGLRLIELTTSHKTNPLFKHTSVLNLDDNIYTLELEKMDDDAENTYQLIMSTPTKIYGPYRAKTKWKSQGANEEFVAVLEYAAGSKIGVGGSVSVGDSQVNIAVEIITPIEEVEKIKIESVYSLLGYEPQITATVNWGPGRNAQFSSMGKWISGRGNAKLLIETPYEGYKEISAGVRLDVSTWGKRSFFKIFGVVNGERSELGGSIDTRHSLDVDFTLALPYTDWKYLSAKLRYGENKDGKTFKLHVRRNSDNFEVGGVLGQRYFNGQLRTPIRGWEVISIEGRVDVTGNEMSTFVEGRRNDLMATVNLLHRSLSTIGGEIVGTLLVPTYDFSVGIWGDYQIGQNQVQGSFVLTNNDDKVVEINGKLFTDETTNLLSISVTKSPLENLRNLEVTFRIFNPSPNHRVASVTWFQDHVGFELSTKLVYEDESGVAYLSFRSIEDEKPIFLISAERDTSTPTKTVTFDLILGPEKSVKVAGTSTSENSLRAGDLKLTTNLGGTDAEYFASYKYDMDNPQKKLVIKLSKDGRSMDVTGTYEANTEIHPGSFVVSIEDELSGQHYYALNVNYETVKKVKSIDATIHVGNVVNEFDLKWTSEENNFHFSTSLSLPLVIEPPYLAISGSISKSGEEKYTVDLKMDLSNEVTELTGELTKHRGQGDFSLSVTSTDKSLTNLKIDGYYDFTSDEKRVSLRLYDGKTAELNVKWQQEKKKGFVDVDVRAEKGSDTRRFSMKANYDFTSTNYEAEMIVDIGGQKYSIELDLIPDRFNGHFKLDMVTPVDGYNNLGAELRYKIDKSKTTASSYVQWANNKKVSLNVDVVGLSGKIIVETRIEEPNTITIELKPTNKDNTEEIQFNILYGENEVIRLNLGYRVIKPSRTNESKRVFLKLSVDTTFQEFDRFEIGLNYSIQPRNLNVNLKLSWPGQKFNRLAVGFGMVYGKLLSVRSALSSTTDPYELRNIEVVFDVRNGVLVKFELDNGRRKLKLFGKYVAGSNAVLFKLESPYQRFKQIIFDLNVDKANKKLDSHFVWNENSANVSGTFDVNPSKSDVSGKIATSFDILRVAGAEINFDFTNPTSTFKLDAQINDDVLAVTVDARPMAPNERSPILEATIGWKKDQKITLTVEVDSIRSVGEGWIKITTPFDRCESNQIKGNYDLRNPRLQFVVSACSQQIVKLEGVLNVDEKKSSVNVNWHVINLSMGSLDGYYDLRQDGRNSRVVLQWDQSTIEANGHVKKTDDVVEVDLVVGSSLSESNVGIVGTFDGSGANKKFNLDVTYDEGERIKINGYVDTEGGKLNGGLLGVKTPFTGAKDLSILTNYKRVSDDILARFALKWGSRDIDNIDLKFSLRQDEINLQVKTPIHWFRHFELDGKITPGTHLRGNVALNDKNVVHLFYNLESDLPQHLNLTVKFQLLHFRPIELEINRQNNNRFSRINFLLNLSTQTFEITAYHSKSDGYLVANAKYTLQERSVDLLATWHPFDARLVLKSDFRAIPAFEVNLKYDRELNEIRANLILPHSTHHIKTNWNFNSQSADISGELMSPFVDSGPITVRIFTKYDDPHAGYSNIRIKCRKSEHALTVDLNWSADENWTRKSLKGIAKLNCPFITSEEIVVDFEGSTSSNKIESSLTFQEKHKFKLTLSTSDQKRNEAVLDVDTPMTTLRKATIGYQVKEGGNTKGIDSFASLTTNVRHYEITANGTYVTQSNKERRLIVDSALKTPNDQHFLSLEGTVKPDGISATVEVISPLLKNKPLLITAQIKSTKGRKVSVDVTTKHGRKKVLVISGLYRKNNNQIRSKLEITTDYFNIKNTSAEFYLETDEDLSSKLTVGRLNTFHSASLVAKSKDGKFESTTKINLFEGSKHGTVLSVSKLAERGKIYSIEVNLDDFSEEKFNFNASLIKSHTNDGTTYSLMVQLTGPFRGISNAEFVVNLNLGVDKTQFDTTYRFNPIKGSGHEVFAFTLRLSKNTRFSLSLQSERREFLLDVCSKDPTLFNAKLKSSWTSHKTIQLSLKADVQKSSKFKGTLIWMDQTLLDIECSISPLDETSSRTVQISLHLKNVRPINVLVKWRRDEEGGISGTIHGTLGDEKVEAKIRKLSKRHVDGKVSIKSPRSEKTRLNFEYLRDSSTVRGGLRLRSRNPRIGDWSTEGSWTILKGKHQFSVLLNMPIANLEWIRVGGNLGINDERSRMFGQVEVELPTRNYSVFAVSNRLKNEFFGLIGASADENKYSLSLGREIILGEYYRLNSTLEWKSVDVAFIDVEINKRKNATFGIVEVKIGKDPDTYRTFIKLAPTETSVELNTPIEGMEKIQVIYKGGFFKMNVRSLTVILPNGNKYHGIVKYGSGEFYLQLSTPIAAVQNLDFGVSDKVYLKIKQFDKLRLDLLVTQDQDGYYLKMATPYKIDAVLVTRPLDNGNGNEILVKVILPTGRVVKLQSWLNIRPNSTLVKFNATVDERLLLLGDLDFTDNSDNQKRDKSLVVNLIFGQRQIRFDATHLRTDVLMANTFLVRLDPSRTPVGIMLEASKSNENDVMLHVVFYCQKDDVELTLIKKFNENNDLVIQAEVAPMLDPERKVAFFAVFGRHKDALFGEVALTQPRAEIRMRLGLTSTTRENVLDLKYAAQSKNHETYYIKSRGVRDKLTNAVGFELITPHGATKLRGHVTNVGDKVVIEIRGYVDKEDSEVDITIQVDNKSVLLNYLLDQNLQHRLIASAKSDDWQSLSFDVDHGPNDQLVKDLSTSLSLNSNRYLKGIFKWRPGTILNATEDMVRGYFNTKDKINTYIVDTLWISIRDQIDLLGSSICHLADLVVGGHLDEMQFGLELLHDIIEEDEFLRDTRDFFDQHFGDGFRWTVRFVRDFLSHTSYVLRSSLNRWLNCLGELLSQIVAFVDEFVLGIESGIKAFAQDPHGTVTFIHNRLLLVLIDMANELHRGLKPLFQRLAISSTQLIDRFVDKCVLFTEYLKDNVVEFIKNAKSIPAISRILDTIADWIPDNTALTKLKDYYHKLNEKYAHVVTKATELFDKLNSHPIVTSIKEAASQAYNKLVWSYKRLDLGKHFTSLWGRFYNTVKESAVDVLREILSDHSSLAYKAPLVTFDPDKGHLSFVQPLPFEWKAFNRLPEFKLDEELQDVNEWKEKIKEKYANPQLDQFLNRVWSKYVPSSSFTTRGFLAGNQHYKSFDGRYFEFAGPCSYLVARDFVDGTFTIVVKYDNDKKRSIVLELDKHVVEIEPDYNVKVNGEEIQHYFEREPVLVSRNGDNLLVRKNQHLQLQCKISYDFCVVELSGWYHGKTGGLLGTFDNEPYTDFTTPERNHTKSIVDFASSWQIGGSQCQTTSNLASIKENSNKICKELLDEVSSPLHSCFKKVNPSPYLQMCDNDVGDSDERRQNQVSTSVAAYVSECNYNKIAVDIPRSAVRCPLVDTDDYAKDEMFQVRSADIIVAVQEERCNDKFIPELLKTINEELVFRGITDNKFKYVGFGQVAQVVNKSFFASVDKLNYHHVNFMILLQHLIELPFRGNAGRAILWFPCSNSEATVSSIDFDNVKNLLVKEKISLHVIREKDYKEKFDLSDVLGFNATEIFYSHSDKNLPTPNHQVQSNSDMSNLAIKSNGSVFFREYFTKPKSPGRQLAVDSLIDNVSSAIESIKCQICGCEIISGLESRATCRSCAKSERQENSGQRSYYTQLEDLHKEIPNKT